MAMQALCMLAVPSLLQGDPTVDLFSVCQALNV